MGCRSPPADFDPGQPVPRLGLHAELFRHGLQLLPERGRRVEGAVDEVAGREQSGGFEREFARGEAQAPGLRQQLACLGEALAGIELARFEVLGQAVGALAA
jgi:hypothetical protein